MYACMYVRMYVILTQLDELRAEVEASEEAVCMYVYMCVCMYVYMYVR